MSKICFVLTTNSGISTATIFASHATRNTDDLLKFFSKYYDVSANYFRDKQIVDILVVPKPFGPVDNDRNLPIIEVPTILFLDRDFPKIKEYIDNYFSMQ